MLEWTYQNNAENNDARRITPLVFTLRPSLLWVQVSPPDASWRLHRGFSCFKAKLIIERDGGQHQDEEDYDLRRTAFLKANGWDVMRFWNNEFRANEEEVLLVILQKLQSLMPCPSPHERGSGGLRAEILLKRPHQRLTAVFQRYHAFAHVFAKLLEIIFLILPFILDRGL